MALEEKRAIDEILIRCNSKTNDGNDGVSITYRKWVEKDGVEMSGTSTTDGPVSADWSDPEVTSRLSEVTASLQRQVDDMTDQINSLESERDTLNRQLADMQAQSSDVA